MPCIPLGSGNEYSSLRLPKPITHNNTQQTWCLWACDNASATEESVERLEQSPGVVRVAEGARLYCKRRYSRREKDFQGHLHDPGFGHSEVASCRFGNVDEPVSAVWAAVLILTTTLLPPSTRRIRTLVPKGSVRWAAVTASASYVSPLAATLP